MGSCNEAVELQRKEQLTCCPEEGCVPPKKSRALKKKDVWAMLDSSGSVPEGERKLGTAVDDHSCSKSDDGDGS